MKTACDRGVVIELLLTWLEVEARRDPCRFHCHRRQQRPWRAQLLLDFPPATGKLDEWRATIRSLVAVANKDEPSPVGPPGRRSDGVPQTSGGKASGAATMVHSPLPHPVPRTPARRDVAGDDISIASSDPRTHCDQRQVLRERAHEDARTTIERRRGARHQSDRRAGPAVNHPAPESPGGLPYDRLSGFYP